MNAIVVMGLRAGKDRTGGPIVRIGVEDDLPHELIDIVVDFISTFDVLDLVIAWYGPDLETMINNRPAIELLDTAGLAAQRFLDANVRSSEDGFVTVLLTDYIDWARCLDVREAERVPYEELAASHVVRPFDELNEAPGVTELVFHGSAPLAIEPEPVSPRVPWSQREVAVMAARAERVRTSQRRKCGNVWQKTLERVRSGSTLQESAPTQAVIGLLNAGLDSILLRDRVILNAVNSNVTEILKVKKHEIGRLLGEATVETGENIGAVIDVLEYIAVFSDDDDPAAFAVAAYLRWWVGDCDGASGNAIVASESDPHYSLAKLVLHALFVDLPPPFSDVA